MRSNRGASGGRSAFLSSSANWLALSVIVGIAVPPLAALLRPLLFPSIFGLVLCSLLLMDLPRVAIGLGRDAVQVLSVSFWQLLALPATVALVHLYTPLGGPFTQIVFYTACAGSLFGAPAFARVMGLDEAMTLRGTLASTLVMPFTLPLLAAWVDGGAAGLDLAGYVVRLAVFLLVPMAIAGAVQSNEGLSARVRDLVAVRHGSVVLLCVFAVGVMDGIGPGIVEAPARMAWLLLLAFAIHLGQFLLTAFVFRARGREFALTAGLLCSYRNLGLLLAVAGTMLPPGFIVFVALWQVPMYVMPLAMARLGAWRSAAKR